MLRLDWNLLFTIINLLILCAVIRRFLMKPVQKILAERQAEADAAMAGVETAKTEAMELKQKYESSLKQAAKEKEGILARAREEAQGEYSRMVTEAQGKAKEIVDGARAEAEAEKSRMIGEVNAQLADLVVSATEKVMAGDLYDQFLDKAGEVK